MEIHSKYYCSYRFYIERKMENGKGVLINVLTFHESKTKWLAHFYLKTKKSSWKSVEERVNFT